MISASAATSTVTDSISIATARALSPSKDRIPSIVPMKSSWSEPTLHPEFAEIAERLARLRDAVAPRIRLAILSNSTTAGWPEVRRGLRCFDDRYMKLDAGDPITYATINGHGASIGSVIDALADLQEIVVQSMFVTDGAGEVDNTTEGALHAWLEALDRIRPEAVHVYTIDRAPARRSLRPVPRRRLREIAEQVRSAGFPAEVFATTRARTHLN
jgi:wyosine [tRNA(Phe)-imidazoG37] synthetase (radical SAM superfamily)